MKQYKLMELRRRLNLTQREMAERIGISRPFYTQIERGTRRPSLEVLHRFAAFFHLGMEEFFLFAYDASCNTRGRKR